MPFWAEKAADPELGPEIGARFDHVLVDEYQDSHRLQAAILAGMKPGGEGVMIVSDDAQSIYAFRGATVRNIFARNPCGRLAGFRVAQLTRSPSTRRKRAATGPARHCWTRTTRSCPPSIPPRARNGSRCTC